METIADASPAGQKTAITSKQPNLKRRREEDSGNDDEPRHFRRVRLKCRRRARGKNCQDEAESEALSGLSSEFDGGMIRCICKLQDKLRMVEDYLDYSPSVSMASNWLIQCVDCKVWQHRSCSGTANGNDPLSGYYCEQCRTAKPV